jgi:hypothetical protein
MKTETRAVGAFNRIELRYTGELYVAQGGLPALTIEADEELLPKLSATVKADTLILELGGDWLEKLRGGFSALTRPGPIYRVSVKELYGLKVSGQGKVELPSLTTDQLELNISGLATISLPELRASAVNVRSSGRGELHLGGEVAEQVVTISGSADYHAFELKSERAQVRISGHGSARLSVSDELDVAISGYGTVEYRWQPQLRQVISGGGHVRPAAPA